MTRKVVSALLLMSVLQGCGSFAPEYQPPNPEVPSSWDSKEGHLLADHQAIDIGWRSFIQDENAERLIEIALENNRDLRIAALNIEKAQAAYGIARADLFPSVSAGLAGNHAQAASDLASSASDRINHSYSGSVGFSSYELDIFGKLKNKAASNKEAWLQLQETRDALQISLIAQVISGYLSLAADQERLAISEQTLSSLEDTLRLTQKRHEMKVDSYLSVSSAEASVESAKVNVETYKLAIDKDKHALGVLLGQPLPEALLPPKALLAGQPVLSTLQAGLTSEVLLRRPDIKADEHALRAANANIGAARAAFFPSITLTTTMGLASGELDRLLRSGNSTWSFIPQITVPIFSAGKLQSALDEAKVAQRISVATYEKDVQVAFQEVADALAVRKSAANTLRALTRQKAAYEKTYHLSELRYKNGTDSYLSMLVYQRSYFNAQIALINGTLAEHNNLVTLYKVLGGGVLE